MAKLEAFGVHPPELAPGEKIVDTYRARMKRLEKYGLAEFLITVVCFILYIIPGIIFLVVWFKTRKEGSGVFTLTSNRLIYREATWGKSETSMHTFSIDVNKINSIEINNVDDRHRKGFTIKITTSYFEALTIGGVRKIGKATGKDFEPDMDASKVMDELYAKILELRS